MGQAKQRRERLARQGCAYCGGPPTGVDHIPPKSIFRGRPDDLITVPSCAEHNNKQSKMDEQFRDLIAFGSGSETDETADLWETMVRATHRNQRRMTEIREKSIWAPEIGRILVPISGKAVPPVLERTTRGLYWHCYGERLPASVPVRASTIKEEARNETMLEFVKGINKRRVGEGQFLFGYIRLEDRPTASIWIYVFHKRVFAAAITDSDNFGTG